VGALPQAAVSGAQGTDYRVWWGARRSARSIATFRTLASSVLALYFARQALRNASEGWLPASLALAALLAALAAAGLAPRLCAAAVYAVGVLGHRSSMPSAGLDAYVASVTALFLALAPGGAAPTPWRKRRGMARDTDARVPALASSVFLVQVALLYGSGALDEAGAAGSSAHPWLALARLVPIALIAPSNAVQAAGLALQLAVHVHALPTTQAPFAHLLLASTSVLFIGEARGRGDGAERWTLDAGGATALLYVLLLAIALGGPLVGAAPAARACGHALSDLALLPERLGDAS